MELPATTRRVTLHTGHEVNRKIMEGMEHRLWYYLDHPERIEERLQALEKEWDMERTLETNASSLALAGVLLAYFAGRKFLLLPTVVTGFLLQHALQGWCPPVPLLRRLGVRTQSEIELERYALKALRGDFGDLEKPEPLEDYRDYPRKVLQAVGH
jgi:hypothetical protein